MGAYEFVSKYLKISFFRIFEVNGASSDGLMTAVLPAAIALTRGPIVVNIGKFHDPTINTVPSGS